jgi:hypothetical protein
MRHGQVGGSGFKDALHQAFEEQAPGEGERDNGGGDHNHVDCGDPRPGPASLRRAGNRGFSESPAAPCWSIPKCGFAGRLIDARSVQSRMVWRCGLVSGVVAHRPAHDEEETSTPFHNWIDPRGVCPPEARSEHPASRTAWPDVRASAPSDLAEGLRGLILT